MRDNTAARELASCGASWANQGPELQRLPIDVVQMSCLDERLPNVDQASLCCRHGLMVVNRSRSVVLIVDADHAGDAGDMSKADRGSRPGWWVHAA